MPKCKLIPTKVIYKSPRDDFTILSCKLVTPVSGIETHPIYHNLTLKGANISEFKLNHRVECIIEPIDDDAHPYSYKFIGFGAFEPTGGKYALTEKQELQALRSLMTNRQAESCHAAYPHFVSMVLNDEDGQIDCKKIKYVKSALLPRYIAKIRSINNRIAFMSEAAKWSIESDDDLNHLAATYSSVDDFTSDIDERPYSLLMDDLGWGYVKADKAAIKNKPHLTSSTIRAEAACIYLLKQNENMGNTRIGASELFNQFVALCPECAAYVYEVVTTSDKLYYEPERKYVSLKGTYQAECHIADVLKKKIANPHYYPMDWQRFTVVDDMALTDEQAQILELACKQDVMMLTGCAGCVDADTEFFTGSGWKRIADYQDGDMVLQYDVNTGYGQMVHPQAYIKKPCNTLWHMETKYGVDMTICDEHRIVYWSPKGTLYECNIKDIIEKQQGNGWHGKFATTFKYMGGSGIDLTDEQIRVMCAVICDGSFQTKSPRSKQCRFHIKKDRKKDRLEQLFNSAHIGYRKTDSAAEGYNDYFIEAPMRTKVFTEEWYNCTEHQFQIICDEIMFWDGSVNTTPNGATRMRFSANVKENAEFVQFAYTVCGYRARIVSKDRTGQQYFTCGKCYTRKSAEYNVLITKHNMVGICRDNRQSHKKTMPTQVATTDGYKYCFTVPSHTLVLRRNGNIFITGNCGKSATTKALVDMLDANNYSYTLLAPTGIANKRLREATGRDASTIHMFLLSEECAGDYVLIDECGMVAVQLLSLLLNRLSDKTKIVFIADPSQLASISCGNVVRDLLDSDIVPTVNLTKIFRYNTSGIITIATDVRNGVSDHLTDTFEDYKFIQIDNSPIKQIEQEYARLLSSGYGQDDILILSPFNKGQCGSLVINNYIQEKFNHNDPSDVGWSMNGIDVRFRIGDKVINKKNEYHMPLYDSMDSAFVANGDMGRIVDIESDDKFPTMVIKYACGDCVLDKAHINKTMLAHCISTHASQGCQSKAVIVVIDRSHMSLLSRNLLYTGISRAQKELVVIGDIDTIKQGLTVQEEMKRSTWLRELLLDKQNKA